MVKSERAHDRISAGFSQLLQFPYILLLGNLLCQKSILQLLSLDYLPVPLIRGNPPPPLTGLQSVVDPAILPRSGFSLLLFLLPLMSSYLPTRGFVLNDDMLKNGKPFGRDYFDELLERIREIRASERRAYQKIADVFEQCSYDYDKNSETTKAFYAFVQNKLHFAVTGKTAAELISERATLDSPTMGLTTWKGAPDGKILKSDTLVAKNYLNEKELSRLNRLVTMFIDYAELMAEDEQLMSMEDWLHETDRFLTNNRRKVLEGKGHISREAAVKKVSDIYAQFRKKQDADYISEFDRAMERYLKGGDNP